VDEHGEPLDFTTTTHPHSVYFNTDNGEFGLAFQNSHTLAFGLPPYETTGIRFRVTPQYFREITQGGEFKSIRNMAYATNGEISVNRIIPKDGGYIVEFIVQTADDCTITLNINENLTPAQAIPPFSEIYASAEKRWQEWFSRVPPVAEEYLHTYGYAWWIMANNLIMPKGRITYEAMMPSKVNYVGLWLWDSAMHTLAYRHINPNLARDQIRAMLSCQLPDGMLPDAIYDEGVIAEIDHPIYAEVTKPPILAWAALKLHEIDPDISFLEEIYIPLVRWNAWWFSMNDDDVDGLVQYNHPYSSGLDDNPLWDYGFPVESPELNTYLCVQMGSLALMAEYLGMDSEAAMWRRRSTALVQRMIADFWDEGAGIFRALNNEQPIPVITPFNLYPLWSGQLPDHIKNRIVAQIHDPNLFWGEYAIPSVARNDPHFDPGTMWRGPIWVNINYFFIEALHQVGEHQLATELTEKTLKLIMQHPSIYEYYDAITGHPPEKAANAFGWTAAVFIDLAIQRTQDSLLPSTVE
jgi:glycogen debranching enzyme